MSDSTSKTSPLFSEKPPEKPPTNGPCEIAFEGEHLYDSVKGGPHSSPSGASCMFVVYTTTQAYPRFLIELA